MIDITELFADPDFCQALEIYRRTENIGTNGRAVPVETSMTGQFGSIQPGANADILRAMDFQANAQLITVYTTFQLQDVTTTQFPDIVVFNGARYEVSKTNPWTAWGAGWIQAICESIQATEGAP